MARGKIKHKSTSIDMTAMCDVAFLLLSFFILTAKFKSSEAVPITTPSSVAAKAADMSADAFVVSIDKLGKVYIELSDSGIRSSILANMETIKGVQLPEDLKHKFYKAEVIGVPFAQLPQYLQLSADDAKKVTLPGIPIDTTGGELRDWITAGLQAYDNNTSEIHFIIKGDNDAKYPVINDILTAFKKNEVYKYKLLTTPTNVPVGSELFKKEAQGGKQDDE
jgi:biopolymer transport protein ExbD